MDDLLREFLTEAFENIATLDVEIIRLERNPNDRDLLDNIFRSVHTIKGGCGFLALPRLGKLAHAGENILGKFRDGDLPITPCAVGLILKSVDAIKEILTYLERHQSEPAGNDNALIVELNALASGNNPALALPAAEVKKTDDQGGKNNISVTDQSIRVDIDQLEKLMTGVSELVLTRNQLLQLARSHKDSPFAAPLQRLHQVTSELQEGVMKTRMQPIGNAWAKLPRIIRDLSSELGKKIDLQMTGAETELDRQVLELIKDPLTHMVRNSADHGIELPADRVKAGKSETGIVALNAYHEGGYIIIRISDDGNGLGLDKIKKKALEKNLAAESELASMSEQQIMQFIFKPGFSTAAQVTSVSGRGVGMDVVKTNIEKIGGTITFQSIPAKGSCFSIKIPLTLAIVPTLIVECAGQRFAIPQICVVELVRASANAHGECRIEHINNAPVLRLRDHLLPLISLRDRLKLGEDKIRDNDKRFIIVIQVEDSMFGIVVDRVFDTEEIVVKPVSQILHDLKIFSGNTILGDGSIVMILDPQGIAANTVAMSEKIEISHQTSEVPNTDARSGKQPLLLFKAGEDAPKAVPLSRVARLERLDRSSIEYSNGSPVIQYRGKLMPLMSLQEKIAISTTGMQSIVVFAEEDRQIGLLVDAILDIVEDTAQLDLSSHRPGFLGTSIISGRSTDIIDVNHFLLPAFQDWFGSARNALPVIAWCNSGARP